AHASDLNCDFSRPCCWSNVGPPRDELDWVQATSLPNDQKFQNVFGSVQKPNTPYLISSSDAAASSVYAILNSCILPCQADTGTLSFKKWTSPQVNLDVCTLPIGSDSYNFCQTVTETGPDVSVPIPPQNGPFQVR
uniref:MAM domain-containing protein n=1 Tax=Romanomermis culicivorax TaxID=13658 RepID=A0A915I038_ROMCU